MLNTHPCLDKDEDASLGLRLALPGDVHLVHWALHCAAAACRVFRGVCGLLIIIGVN